MRNKIKPFDVYVFDVMNTLNLKENNVMTVQVLKIKRRLFRKTLYGVISLQTGELFTCYKAHLTPLPKVEDKYVIVRYPDNIPIINAVDIAAINEIITETDSRHRFYKELCKLRAKLNFYYEVTKSNAR